MRKSLIFLVVMMIIPGLVILAGDKPKVKKGAELTVVSGTLIHWKDIEKVDFTKTPEKRKLKAILNFQNPRRIVKKSDAVDPVVQKSSAGLQRETMLMPTPINHFAGMNLSQHGAGWPPDTCGDVGLTYYVQAVNTSIGIYNKSTGAQVSTTTFDAFFPSSVGSPCDNDNQGDPIVLFDQYNILPAVLG